MRNILSVLICFITFSATAQTVKLRLPESDIVDILRAVKQDMVYDTLDVPERLSAVKSCEKAIKNIKGKDGGKANIDIPQDYLVKWLERNYYQFEEHERSRNEHDKFLRVLSQIQENDEKLKIMKDSPRLEFVRKRALRALKKPEDFDKVKKQYSENELDENGDVK